MTLNEALQTADEHGNPWDDDAEQAAVILAATVRRLQSATCKDCSLGHMTEKIRTLQSENTALRLYAPARRAQPTVKTAPIAPMNWPAWGMIDETDEQFAERAGRKVAAVGA